MFALVRGILRPILVSCAYPAGTYFLGAYHAPLGSGDPELITRPAIADYSMPSSLILRYSVRSDIKSSSAAARR